MFFLFKLIVTIKIKNKKEVKSDINTPIQKLKNKKTIEKNTVNPNNHISRLIYSGLTIHLLNGEIAIQKNGAFKILQDK